MRKNSTTSSTSRNGNAGALGPRRTPIDPWEASSGMASTSTPEPAAPVCIHQIEDLVDLAAADPGAGPVTLAFHHALRAHQAPELIRFLQRADVEVVALHLHLSAAFDVPVLTQLLAAIDGLKALDHLALLLDGPLDDGMRCALARSPACLRLGSAVRRMLFAYLGRRAASDSPDDRHRRAVLRAFVKGSLSITANTSTGGVGAALLALALQVQDEALLIGVWTLLGGGPLQFVAALPKPSSCALMDKAGLPWALVVDVACSQDADALSTWLRTAAGARPCSIVVDVRGRVEGRSWVRLLNLLVAQVANRPWMSIGLRLKCEEALPVVQRRNALPVRPRSLHVDLSETDPSEAQTHAIASVVGFLGPMYLSLTAINVVTAATLVREMYQRACPPLRGLYLEWSVEHSGWFSAQSQSEVLLSFRGPGFVRMCLPDSIRLEQRNVELLDRAAEMNPLLNGFELLLYGRLQWCSPSEHSPPIAAVEGFELHRARQVPGVVQKARWRLGAQAFIQNRLLAPMGVDTSLARYLMEVGRFSVADLRAIANVSWSARRAGQAAAIVETMDTMNPDLASLCALFTGPDGTLDSALLRDVRQRVASPTCTLSAEKRHCYLSALDSL